MFAYTIACELIAYIWQNNSVFTLKPDNLFNFWYYIAWEFWLKRVRWVSATSQNKISPCRPRVVHGHYGNFIAATYKQVSNEKERKKSLKKKKNKQKIRDNYKEQIKFCWLKAKYICDNFYDVGTYIRLCLSLIRCLNILHEFHIFFQKYGSRVVLLR